MPLHDFYRERRVVQRGGRRFTCSKPSLLTVHLFVGLFEREILTVARTVAEGSLGLADPAADLLPVFLSAGQDRIGRVLETCVTEEGAGPCAVSEAVAASPDLAADLCRAVLSLCNVERIVASLQIDAALAAAAAGAEASQPAHDRDQAWAVGLVARAFGMSLEDVVHMPYEAFITIVEDLAPMLPGAQPAAGHAGGEQADADQLATMGFQVHKATVN